MANVPISDLPAAASVAADDTVAIVQGGTTKRTDFTTKWQRSGEQVHSGHTSANTATFSGLVEFNDAVSGGDAAFDGTLTVGGALIVDAPMSAADLATFGSAVTFNGPVEFNDSVSGGDAAFDGTLTANVLRVDGAMSAADLVTFGSAVTFNGDVSGGNAVFDGTLAVGGAATFDGAVSAASLRTDGELTLTGAINQDCAVSGDIAVFQPTYNSNAGLFVNSNTDQQIDIVSYTGSTAASLNLRPATAPGSGFLLNKDASINMSVSLVMGGASGAHQGTGTINAVGVYDDGALLSGYVLDQYVDGSVSSEKWDGMVPNRVLKAVVSTNGSVKQPKTVEERSHTGASRFKGYLGGPYDPLDIDKYTQHMKDKRHLPGLIDESQYDPKSPVSLGDWVQRLVETVETQAVHIDQLNQRLKALEP